MQHCGRCFLCRTEAEALRTCRIFDQRGTRYSRLIDAGAVDVEVAIRAGRAAIGVVEERHRGRVSAGEGAQHGKSLELCVGMERGRGLRIADLLTVDLNRELSVAIPGILAHLQDKAVRAGTDRHGVDRRRGRWWASKAEALRTCRIFDQRGTRYSRLIDAGAVDVEVAIRAGRAAIGVVEERHRGRVSAGEGAQHGKSLELCVGMERGRGLRIADLLTVDLNRELSVAIPGILAHLQDKAVRAGTDRHGVDRRRGKRYPTNIHSHEYMAQIRYRNRCRITISPWISEMGIVNTVYGIYRC